MSDRVGLQACRSAWIASYELAFRMQSAAPDVVDLDRETPATRDRRRQGSRERRPEGDSRIQPAPRGPVRIVHLEGTNLLLIRAGGGVGDTP